jgi:hypothetical protein
LQYEIAEQVANSLRVIKAVESLNFVGQKKNDGRSIAIPRTIFNL